MLNLEKGKKRNKGKQGFHIFLYKKDVGEVCLQTSRHKGAREEEKMQEANKRKLKKKTIQKELCFIWGCRWVGKSLCSQQEQAKECAETLPKDYCYQLEWSWSCETENILTFEGVFQIKSSQLTVNNQEDGRNCSSQIDKFLSFHEVVLMIV